MLTTTLYTIGLLLRLAALFISVRIVFRNRSWRYVVIAIGTFWISFQPVLQYFFSHSISFISQVQQPQIFVITSSIALFVIYQFDALLRDNERFEQKELEKLEQSDHRNAVLLRLAKERRADLQSALSAILTECAKELVIDRVSVWSFSESRTRIEPLLFLNKNRISSDIEPMDAVSFPNYFAALQEDTVVVANNARAHPATREFTETYLIPNDIYSMLDVPIRMDGETIGIICHEQTGAFKNWTSSDEDFAHSIADLCALAIAAERRREISNRLEASERHLRNAQNAGQFGSFRWELDNNDVIWSGEALKDLGFSYHNPLSYEDFKNRLSEGELSQYEASLRQAAKERKPLLARFKSKPEFGGKHYEVRANYRPAESTASACFEGTVQNVTDQVLAEREHQNLEAQLIQSQKMESIGTLAGGIAHDFNNILTPILGYADIALSEIEPDSPLKGTLEEILHSSLRAKDIVEQILVFGRRWDEKREPLDLQDSITSALKLIRPTLPGSINIELDIAATYPLVDADATQMIQVLVNLCTNAWHAMEPNGGNLTIKLYPSTDQPLTILEVTDTGSGIESAASKRIFEPFYTTKEVGKGTGLGLAVVHGIVTKLGGTIEVISEPGKFTTFKLSLPTTDSRPIPRTVTIPAQRQSASILLVDDDEAVAGTLNSMLTDLGYKVDVHIDSQKALQCFTEASSNYDLVLTDLTMPNLSGIELTRKIREHSPDLPVFIISGYGADQVHQQIADLEHCYIVSKPIIKDDLARALDKELH